MPWAEVKVDVSLPGHGVVLSLEELNGMFYESYPRRFFQAALHLAAAGYLDPSGALSPLAELVVIKGELGEGALQIQLDVEDEDVTAVREASRLQIAGLYHHALETFVRLFLAHAPGVACPWMQLVRDEGPPFTKKVKRLEKWSEEWASSADLDDEHVRLAFFPVKGADTGTPSGTGQRQELAPVCSPGVP
jgi:hypothetical protein